jgi:oligopeptide/dipeptide ABC transporter ATP-binding protein
LGRVLASARRSAIPMTAARTDAPVLLEARNIVQDFVVRAGGVGRSARLRALSNVSFEIRTGETLGLVGESGCGKTTLARTLLQAPPPRSGSVLFRGRDITRLRHRELLEPRREIQIVFQDPFTSLNPAWKTADIVAEPLVGYRWGTRAQRLHRVGELLERVGLSLSAHGRVRPRELSGGQCQRVAVARALALDPALIICDEAVSALDVLIQAQLLNLFEELRRERSLAYLFISHDLAVVKQVSDRIAVLYLGQLCEIGPAESVFATPRHPYTARLLACISGTTLNPSRNGAGPAGLSGELPSPLNPPSGCRFRTRCPHARDRCALEEPQLRATEAGHLVACHFPLQGSLDRCIRPEAEEFRRALGNRGV